MELLVLASESFLLLHGLLVEMLHLLQLGIDCAQLALGSLQFHIEFVDADLKIKPVIIC